MLKATTLLPMVEDAQEKGTDQAVTCVSADHSKITLKKQVEKGVGNATLISMSMTGNRA